MKRLRSVAFCSVAALAVSAVVAGSASAALPEFSGPFPKPLKSKGGKALIETAGVKLTCTALTDVGEVLGAKNGKVVVRLTGCSADGFTCTTPGAAEGEMVTSELSTTLGYINKEKREVGIALAAVSPTPFEEFECAGLKIVVEGSVIGKLTPINKRVKPTSHFTLKFTQKKSVQTPRKLEGEPVDVLEGHLAGEPLMLAAGLKAKDEITLVETGEIKA
jgi:antitoxin (DNA-binding transcriptional repressor) of toxin-antitoxin stability system